MKEKLKQLFAPVDMTKGKPWKKIVAFTIPLIIGNIAQQLYNTVDSIVVGKYVGDNALAAVGSAVPILNLLLVLFIWFSVGSGIMVSQYFGARDREELSWSKFFLSFSYKKSNRFSPAALDFILLFFLYPD